MSASGHVSTSAFYELLPSSSINISSITVSPGDQLSAVINEISSGVWDMTITDTTNNQSFSLQVNYTSSNSSVEWVEEDPSYANGHLVPFDDFGTATFTNASTVSSGSTMNLSTASAQPITLVSQSDQPIATPSAITGSGAGFTVTHS